MRLAVTAIGAAMLLAAAPASAAPVIVQAQANSSSGGAAASFGTLTAGQTITWTSSLNDLWSAGSLPRFSDANGLTGDRFATAADDSGQPVGTQIGANFGLWTQNGFTAPFGALVGLFNGTYSLLGANGSFTAPGAGTLQVYYWDSNNGDNTGQIAFDVVTAVPEPLTWSLMILGLGAVGGALRRRQRLAVAFQS